MPAFSQVDLNDGLIACYSFSGNPDDGSGNNNHGTVFGPSLVPDRFGTPNSAYKFDGADDYIRIPSAPLILNRNYTYSVWINVTNNPSFSGSGTLISIGNSAGRHLGMTLTNHYATAEFVGWTVGGSNSATTVVTGVTSGVLPQTNTWYHIVSTRSDATLTLYVNGVAIGTDATNGTLPLYFDADTYLATLGIRTSLTQPINAVMDDVALYQRALTAEEVLKLYEDGLPCLVVKKPNDMLVSACGSKTFSLTAEGGAHYRWYDSETGGDLLFEGNPFNTLELSQTTSYFVANVINGVESARGRIEVVVHPQPEVICSSDYLFLAGEIEVFKIKILSGTPVFTADFDFGDNTTTTTIVDSVTHAYTSSGTYTVEVNVKDLNGCEASCSNLIEVIEETIYIPNVITPDNGDEKNQVFTLYIEDGPESYRFYHGTKSFSMRIYNRWGGEVFKTDNVIRGWEGKRVATGMYYYAINFGTNSYRGWVNVLR